MRALSMRNNCFAVAAALLQNQAPTLSLSHLANIQQEQIRFPPRRLVDKALRVRDLSNLDPVQTYMCFWCEPLCPKDHSEPPHDSLTSFRPEFSDINAYRLHCYYTEKA